MQELMGMSLDTWRTLTVIGALSAAALYGYRLYCVIDLMRSTSEKLTDISRLIYAGLIILVPAGLGAWLYEYVVNGKKASPFFWVPGSVLLVVFLTTMAHTIPNATKFNFDFFGW